ncbi:hypothetical protein C8J57DRAFT_1569626, partial [Mycena rebaudengoi]
MPMSQPIARFQPSGLAALKPVLYPLYYLHSSPQFHFLRAFAPLWLPLPFLALDDPKFLPTCQRPWILITSTGHTKILAAQQPPFCHLSAPQLPPYSESQPPSGPSRPTSPLHPSTRAGLPYPRYTPSPPSHLSTTVFCSVVSISWCKDIFIDSCCEDSWSPSTSASLHAPSPLYILIIFPPPLIRTPSPSRAPETLLLCADHAVFYALGPRIAAWSHTGYGCYAVRPSEPQPHSGPGRTRRAYSSLRSVTFDAGVRVACRVSCARTWRCQMCGGGRYG